MKDFVLHKPIPRVSPCRELVRRVRVSREEDGQTIQNSPRKISQSLVEPVYIRVNFTFNEKSLPSLNSWRRISPFKARV